MPRNEADTRAQLIDPALHERGWAEEHIRREQTPGAIDIIDGQPQQFRGGRIDYVLRFQVNMTAQPLAMAIIEAKSEDKPPDHGLQQAKAYADCMRMHVPFVFSSNGHQFVEFDATSQITSNAKPMADFPTPAELRERYEAHVGFSLDDQAARPLLTPYSGGEATRRYYQDAAIRAVFEKVARCQRKEQPKRALLSMATGAGKTFIAVNMLKRIADAGQLRRALFVCDRDELRAQGLGAMQAVFGDDAAPVYRSNGSNNAEHARIHVATYQTLDVDSQDDSGNFLTEFYPPDHFSHIIIDECHRSAWGKWSQVLTRNPNAVQVGLTATPRQLDCKEDTAEARDDIRIIADNYAYFGEPVYEYDMAQAMEDGYLAGCEIVQGRVDIDNTGITLDQIMARDPIDAITGRPITEAELKDRYKNADLDDKLALPDRVAAMCQDFFDFLTASGDPHQKTIIFCARDYHAQAVANEMNNLYAKWCSDNDQIAMANYAFKCTAASNGQQYVADLRGSSRSHFIATTVDLLSTGVDIPRLQNIAFFKYVKSPINFYQMVGRGTRIDPATQKLMFRVYDYTNATRLFGSDFLTKKRKPRKPGGDGPGPQPNPIITVQGFDVTVDQHTRSVFVAVDGQHKAVPIDEYEQMLVDRLIAEASDVDQFRQRWCNPDERRAMLEQLPAGQRSAMLVRDIEDMEAFDLYDVLGQLGYQLHPRSRVERAGVFLFQNESWLTGMPAPASNVIKALANQFGLAGTDGLESRQVFQTNEVRRAGGLQALTQFGEPADVLHQTKQRIFAA